MQDYVLIEDKARAWMTAQASTLRRLWRAVDALDDRYWESLPVTMFLATCKLPGGRCHRSHRRPTLDRARHRQRRAVRIFIAASLCGPMRYQAQHSSQHPHAPFLAWMAGVAIAPTGHRLRLIGECSAAQRADTGRIHPWGKMTTTCP